MMRTGGIGGSLFLIALGAILYWAVSVEGEGFDVNMIGLILLIVGICLSHNLSPFLGNA